MRDRDNSKNISRNNSRLVRNNSVDSMRRRNDSVRSIENNPTRKVSERSHEKVVAGRAFVEDISNRCRNIKERVELMMANQRGDRLQKVSNSYEKRYNLPLGSSKDKREPSNGGRLSRNNSIEIKPNNAPVRPMVVRRNSERSLERNRSQERI